MQSHLHLPPRPPWWPKNEEWPPRDRRHWRRIRRPAPFFRRLGCVFALFNLLGLAAFLSVGLWVANLLGLTHLTLQQVGNWLSPVAAAAFGLMVAALIVGGVGLRRISVPLDDMLAASDRVAEGDYSVRVEEKGPREVRSLARAFNSMVQRLQANEQQRRNLFADVTHELRTPLTVIQGNVEGILDGLYPADEKILKSILEETELLSRLVDDLRTLALAESGALQLKRESTDLAALARETVTGFGSRAEAAGVRLETSLVESPPVEVDPLRVREVLSNLIFNALRYSPRGGSVQVGYDGREISVTDEGPGIPPEDLPHVFERFYKSGDSGGMGLGLSIAKALIEAHGGEIRAESQPGRGAKISFTLLH